MERRFDLFHRLADPGSAAVRRYLVAQGREAQVRFKNVHFPEASAELSSRGGAQVPALWTGEELVQGAEAILAWLAAHPG